MNPLRKLWLIAPLWRIFLVTAVFFSVLTGLYWNSSLPLRKVVQNQPPAAINQTQQDNSTVKFGDIEKGKVSFAGRVVPLPPGDWSVVAHIPYTGAGGISMDSMVLAMQTDDTLTGLIYLVGNNMTTPAKTGFRSNGVCERTDLNYVHVISNNDFGSQDCQTVDYINVSGMDHPGADNLTKAAYGEMKNKNYKFPTTLVGSTFHFADQQYMLTAAYFFSPENEGISAPASPIWSDSDWNKYAIEKFPEKKAYIDRLIAWTDKVLPALRDCFAGKPKSNLSAP